MPDKKFSHLPLPLIAVGQPKITGMGSKDKRTEYNKTNRVTHGTKIKRKIDEISRFWVERQEKRKKEGLPDIKTGIPLLLEIDPNSDLTFLKGLGFDIVSELDSGYVIVSNDDVSFKTLYKKTDDFINEVSKRCNTPAKIYTFSNDECRFDKICGTKLSSILKTIENDSFYCFDVSISCSGNVFDLDREPLRSQYTDEDSYLKDYNKWKKKYDEAYQKWDDLCYERQENFKSFVESHSGSIENGFIQEQTSVIRFPDSFSTRIRINGKCLLDLLYNYSPLFSIEIVDSIDINTEETIEEELADDLIILPPDDNSPAVAVIDSGIEENHRLIESAIIKNESICYVRNSDSVSDEVESGGHGTRVAGAILYPYNIPESGEYKLPCFIQNMRVLNKENQYSYYEDVFPPLIIQDAVKKYHIQSPKQTKIFNHSIAENTQCELIHMSPWATSIDDQSYEHDVLFIQATGNLSPSYIKQCYDEGLEYPHYLFEEDSRIANPSQSLNALTVGSISLNSFESNDEKSIAEKYEPSSFTRIGAGIWNSTKPDVVEFGGDWIKSKYDNRLSLNDSICPDLVKVSPEGPSHSRDDVGTSFSTPKVAFIAAEIQKLFPNSPALLYRALIAQSAEHSVRVGNRFRDMRTITRCVGYGFPDLTKATRNDEYRITLITPNEYTIYEKQAHIFRIPIPKEINEIGENYRLKLSVTLSYAAKPRNTRRTLKRYLSTWLDWRCSKKGESLEAFKTRIFVTDSSVDDDGNYNWVIGERSNTGQSKDFSRSNNTLQKDWTIINSNELTDDFCIAVRAHKGWNANLPAKYVLVVTFEALDSDIEIYEPIRNLIEVETEINNQQQIEIENTL